MERAQESRRLSGWRRILTRDPAADETRSRIRQVLNSLILHLHPTRVPAGALRFTYTWGLGGICATLATVLAVTGVLLMFRYEPTVDRAYASIQELEAEVVFGSLIRGVHHWSATLLVVTSVLHMVRVFLSGGFKQGRFTNWLVGLGLLALVLAFEFTGFLLPWDQLAYWAMTVVSTMISYVPMAGKALSRMVLAGPEVGQGTLSNFYALHVALLPAVGIAALSYHFWRVRKDGGISRPRRWEDDPEEYVTTIPHLVRIEAAVAAVVITLVVVWSMAMPAPLDGLADPNHPPTPAKAAWYFVGLQELLLHMDPLAFLALMGLIVAGIVLVPIWDRREEAVGVYFRSPVGRRAALMGTALSLYAVPLLVVMDEYWLNLPAMLPGLPTIVSNGLIPLVATLAGLAGVYALPRRLLKADHSEALVGLFSFLMGSLVMLTIIGNLFRGEAMVLGLPF